MEKQKDSQIQDWNEMMEAVYAYLGIERKKKDEIIRDSKSNKEQCAKGR